MSSCRIAARSRTSGDTGHPIIIAASMGQRLSDRPIMLAHQQSRMARKWLQAALHPLKCRQSDNALDLDRLAPGFPAKLPTDLPP